MSVRSFRRAHARRLEQEARRGRALARRGRLLAGATLTATALMTANAQAAGPYVVNTSADDAPGGTCTPGLCTLRDAVGAANADASASTITFDPSVTGPIVLTNGAIALNNANGMKIQGPGASKLTVSGADTSQIFTLSNAQAASPKSVDAINGLTLTHGSGNQGGAINAVPSLSPGPGPLFVPISLTDDVISNSKSTSAGGAIATNAPLTLNHTTISGNTARKGGGIGAYPLPENTNKYGNLVTVENHSVITGNHATDPPPGTGLVSPLAGGGGILAGGDTLIVSDSTITGNTSTTSGGGIAVSSKYGTEVIRSTISGNTAVLGGGIEFYGFQTTLGPSQYRFHKYSPGVLDASTITGNQASDGAGVHVTALGAGSPLTIESTTISGNQGGAKSFGGGIGVTGNLVAPFRLLDSTISGNSAANGGGISLGDGYHYPLIGTNPANGKPGSVSLDNSTIAGNTATAQGGGIYLGHYKPSGSANQLSGSASLESTIVAGNKVAGAVNDLTRSSVSTSGGFAAAFSLIQASGTAPLTQKSVITGQSPNLGALGQHGGPTATMVPASDSPVIDQGHNSQGLATDQNGNARTVDNAVANPPGGDGTDIGSVELSSGQVSIPGFAAKIGSKTLGGGSTPLLVGTQTPVTCSVKVGLLGSCVIEVRLNGFLLGGGGVAAGKSTRVLSTTVQSSPTAQKFLMAHYPLGVNATADAVGSTGAILSVLGPVHYLPVPSIVLQLGTRAPKLSKHVVADLGGTAKLLIGARRVTCTAYTDQSPTIKRVKRGGKPPLSDLALTRGWAKAACGTLGKDGVKAKFKSIGGGASNPVVPNSSAKNRALNRRLVITFVF